MLGTTDFCALLQLLRELELSTLTASEKVDAIAVASDHFRNQAHDPRLTAIVERLTAPPVVEPVVAPKTLRARR